ncbi:hypothetical protein [Pedobacter sp. R20-19]|uniref:hypothetical protein n=1 Tax=Pedobacter sp. R20-19 TaxID=1270196 RepID=UPI000493A165|nr:hypothetical protein [Pedobacter sp. R20-19]
MEKNKNQNENQAGSLNEFSAHKLSLTSTVKGGNGLDESLSASSTVTSTGYTAGDDWDFHFES